MSPSHIVRTQRLNFLKTIFYLAIMLLVMGALGYAFLGWEGLIWGLGFTLVLAGFSGRFPTEMIMRFYRGRPLQYYEAPELFAQVKELSYKAGLDEIPKLYLLQQRGINAFATGHAGDTAIGVTAGLLRALNARESYGVLAHEISHIKNKDLKVSQLAMLINRLTRMFAFVAQVLLFINLPFLLMGEAPFSFVAILLLIIAPSLSIYLQLAISRTRELDADLEAAKLTGDPNGLANALERIEWFSTNGWDRLFRPEGQGMKIPAWLRSHPTTRERIRRLRGMDFLQRRA